MEFTIIPVFEAQLSECCDVLTKSFSDDSENPNASSAFSTDRLLWELTNGVYMFGAYLPDKTQIGFMALDVREHYVTLEKLCVLPNFRRNGIGSALVAHAKTESLKYSDTLRIGVTSDSTDLITWYEKFGFVTTENKHYEHLPFDVFYMEIKN